MAFVALCLPPNGRVVTRRDCVPIFRSDRASDIARVAKTFPNPGESSTRDALPDVKQRGDPMTARQLTPEQRKRVKSKRQELRRKKRELREIRSEALATKDWAERT